MGVADFPVEIFKAFKSKPKSTANDDTVPSQADAIAAGSSLTPSQLSPKESSSRSRSQLNLSSLDGELARLPTSTTASAVMSLNGSESTATTVTADTSTWNPPLTTTQGGALKQSLSTTPSRSRSTSRDRKPISRSSSQFPRQDNKPFDPSTITLESAIGASKGLSRIVGAGLKSPMDFTLGLARGFHNAPKLYGDDTVRPQQKVTDFQSGLKAAGKVRSLHFHISLHTSNPFVDYSREAFGTNHKVILESVQISMCSGTAWARRLLFLKTSYAKCPSA